MKPIKVGAVNTYNSYKKVRRTWNLNPRDRIKESKKKDAPPKDECCMCKCKDLMDCLTCEYYNG
jgi:hypothetical protein